MRFVLLFIMVFCMSCETLNSFISPEKQCSLLRTGARTGLKIALDQLDKDGKFEIHKGNVASILEKQILPKLKGGEGLKDVTREDLDWALALLDKELGEKEKIMLQNGIDLVLTWSPDFPKDKGASVAGQLLNNIICFFEGILEGFVSSQKEEVSIATVGTKSIKPVVVLLKWECSPCKGE